jgi:uncharacterized membrane protein
LTLGWLAVARYDGFNAAMFDLGNMVQAIWSVGQGQPLIYSRQEGIGVSRMVGHAEIVYTLLALPYALWPDPRLLLVLQAALYALGALPVYRLAARRVERRFAARCAAIIYLLYPVAQTGILFDLHGDPLAMPLLLFALDALDERAWRRYALFIALALACKLYVAAVVTMLGLLLVWRGERRVGVFTAAAGLIYGVVLLLARPLFLPPEVAVPASPASAGIVTSDYFSYYFGAFERVLATLPQRLANLLVVLGPALLLAWRGWRWLVPALPILGAVLVTSGPGGASDYRYHHYALVVPFIVMAVVEGMARARVAEETRRAVGKRIGRTWQGDTGLTVAIVVLCSALLVNWPLNPLFWLRAPGYGLDASVYGATPRDAVIRQFLAEGVPPGEPLVASPFLAPHLANRQTLYLTRYPDEPRAERLPGLLPQVRYAVPDALFDWYVSLDEGYGGGIDHDRDAIGVLLRDPAFALTGMRDGLLLFERDAPPEQRLVNTLARRMDAGGPAIQRFGVIELVRSEVVQVGPQRLRAMFVWRLERPLVRGERFVAVSRLGGVANARFVHLPGYALSPVWEWPVGELVEEVFEVELPAEVGPGTYEWQTGWYDVRRPASRFTDARTFLPGSEEIVVATVEVR